MKKKKRILSILLMVVFVLAIIMPAYAQTVSPLETKGRPVTCGFTAKGGDTYQFWGKLRYTENANLSISVYLYSSNGSSILSSCSNVGTGASISARKTVVLSSGTYIVKAFGYVDGVYLCQNETSISIP